MENTTPHEKEVTDARQPSSALHSAAGNAYEGSRAPAAWQQQQQPEEEEEGEGEEVEEVETWRESSALRGTAAFVGIGSRSPYTEPRPAGEGTAAGDDSAYCPS